MAQRPSTSWRATSWSAGAVTRQLAAGTSLVSGPCIWRVAVSSSGASASTASGLVSNLPRQGLLKETLDLIRLARHMEANQNLVGHRITEFDHLFGA